MKFYEYVRKIIEEKLNSRDNLPKVIEDLRQNGGTIAFYPCNKTTRIILERIKKTSPELLSLILGCFDNAENATTEEGISTYNVKELDGYKDRISLLVVASNNFYAKELKNINELTQYDGPIRKTTYFELSLEQDTDEVLTKIDEVYNLLEDAKSKMTYLLFWLSNVLNEEEMTHIFESEKNVEDSEETEKYKGFKIKGLKDIYNRRELQYEIYKMKYLCPNEGDTIFDIGAYIGDTAIFFASYVGKNGKVYSFEPIKANYDSLVETIGLNKLEDVVVPVNKACSNQSKIAKAVSVDTGAPWSFLSEDAGQEEVDAISIDDFIKSRHISKVDIIKMDVEGHERAVILGAKETIKRMRPKMVICLYHKTEDLIQIPLLVSGLGDYKIYVRCPTEGPYSVNLYCVPR